MNGGARRATGGVLVAGSANLDVVVRAASIPRPGETVLARELRRFPGGKGANQAVAAARAGGAATRMLLALGDDREAATLEASLREAGVELVVVRDPVRPTGAAFVCVDDRGENAIAVAPGANLALAPAHLPPLDGVAVLLLQLETPLASVTAYARAARAAGVTVALNAAPAQPLPEALLAAVDLLIVNEGELGVVAGVAMVVRRDAGGDRAGGARTNEAGLDAALDRLAAVPTVVVTLGASGALARTADGRRLKVPAFPVETVDTTGAGDTFCGVLVAAMARGTPLEPALREAAAAAALACTRPGAQSSIPIRAEVLARVANEAARGEVR